MIESALTGRLGRDPDHKLVKGGALPMLALAIAVEDKAGSSTWVRVTVFGDRADELAATLVKGDRCYVEGRLTLDTWTGKDGAEKSGLSVVATLCQPLGKIGRQRPRQDGGQPQPRRRAAGKRKAPSSPAQSDWQAPLDDDISDIGRQTP